MGGAINFYVKWYFCCCCYNIGFRMLGRSKLVIAKVKNMKQQFSEVGEKENKRHLKCDP